MANKERSGYRAPTVPVRLHVLLAQDAPSAVVVLRGRDKQTALIGWNRLTDEFTLGQWMQGRLYELQSDLSPDGRHFIYKVFKGRRGPGLDDWTAISLAPYLKAKTLYMNPVWSGGGLFLSNSQYWLDERQYDPCALEFDSALLEKVNACPWQHRKVWPTYFFRLIRGGWTIDPSTPVQPVSEQPVFFEKPINAWWRLRKAFFYDFKDRSPGRSYYYETHALVSTQTDETRAFDEWSWADVDGPRLVWAANGQIWCGHTDRHGLVEPATMLHDFNSMGYRRILAPY